MSQPPSHHAYGTCPGVAGRVLNEFVPEPHRAEAPGSNDGSAPETLSGNSDTPSIAAEYGGPEAGIPRAPKASLPNAQRGHKIVIQIAGDHPQGCCESIVTGAVKNDRGRIIELPRIKAISDAVARGNLRHEVVLSGLSHHPRDVGIRIACRQANDGNYDIPLLAGVFPVDGSVAALQRSTLLIPWKPLVYTDRRNSASKAADLSDCWLYIFLDGHLWREIYAETDGTFRDVNLELPDRAENDIRAASGHPSNVVLTPFSIAGRQPVVEIAVAHAQWTWRTLCAMGGPADGDRRFLHRVILNARRIALEDRRRLRFTQIDFTNDLIGRASTDGMISPLKAAGMGWRERKIQISLQQSRSPAVFLHDPLVTARTLAARYQAAWKAMEDLLARINHTPLTDQHARRYPPARWFDSALLATHFFYGPFPTPTQWQSLHPGQPLSGWRQARRQRRLWRARLDRSLLAAALETSRRRRLRRKIERTKHHLVMYLTQHTRRRDSLLVMLIEDFFLLPAMTGCSAGIAAKSRHYPDGWGLLAGLLARLGDPPGCLDAALEADPPDNRRLAEKDPGTVFLNHIADPRECHPWHSMLFPPAHTGDPCHPVLTPLSEHLPEFKPQRFSGAVIETASISAFILLFARSAMVCNHPRVRQSILRLLNAVYQCGFSEHACDWPRLTAHAARHPLALVRRQALYQEAITGAASCSDIRACLCRWTIFGYPEPQFDEEQSAPRRQNVDSVESDAAEREVAQHGWKIIHHSHPFILVKTPIADASEGWVRLGPDASPLHLMTPDGQIAGLMPLAQLRCGHIFAPRACAWPDTQLTLIQGRPEDATLFAAPNDPSLFAKVLIPLAAMLEMWNARISADQLLAQVEDRDYMTRLDILANIFDLGTLRAALLFEARWCTPKTDSAAPCGVDTPIAALRDSAFYAVGDLLMGNPSCMHPFTLVTLLSAGVGAYFNAAMTQRYSSSPIHTSAIPMAEGAAAIAAIAACARLACRCSDDELLLTWLDKGPFSCRKFKLPVIHTPPRRPDRRGLIVDENGRLTAIVPETGGRLRREGEIVYVLDRNGKKIRPVGVIGRPLDSEALIVSDPSGRFGGHRPGETDFGPPPGGRQCRRYYPGTRRKLEFWQEPNGSFLWTAADGTLVDCKIIPGGRLYVSDRTLMVGDPSGDIAIGRLDDRLWSKDPLMVDRKSNGNRLRTWCEEPHTAFYDLAGRICRPAVDLSFACRPRPAVKYPGADPFTGYDYFCRMNIVVPHFVPHASRLLVELWEQFDAKPVLHFNDRICLIENAARSCRQVTIIWPLETAYARCTRVTAKVCLDWLGEGGVCLPLPANDDHKAWCTTVQMVDKFALLRQNPDWIAWAPAPADTGTRRGGLNLPDRPQ
jgi:hypothetical protein